MTKSSARKAAAEKARSTYRSKTTRKVGTGKADGSDHKTASRAVAEGARDTYSKTAARFEEFAYDAQMPGSMRALAEKSVAQTWELYVHSLEAVLESWQRFVVKKLSQSSKRSKPAVRVSNPRSAKPAFRSREWDPWNIPWARRVDRRRGFEPFLLGRFAQGR
jgi:inactivated superfamily I helicase